MSTTTPAASTAPLEDSGVVQTGDAERIAVGGQGTDEGLGLDDSGVRRPDGHARANVRLARSHEGLIDDLEPPHVVRFSTLEQRQQLLLVFRRHADDELAAP